jgi:hypothetical protein
MLNVWLTEAPPALTWRVKVELPTTVGVPEMVTNEVLVLVINVRPVGSDPDVIAQVNGVAAPPAVTSPV